MLDRTKFVVKEQKKAFSTMLAYEIVDPDNNRVLAVVTQKAGWLATIMAMVIGKDSMSLTMEVRESPDDKLAFIIRRSGFFFKKVELLDDKEQLVGSFKAKSFSLSGGYDIYDKDAKHFASMNGNLFKADFKFTTPEGAEMGDVSKTWGSVAKELFTGATTYGVTVSPKYLDKTGGHDETKIMLILGGALAVDAMFKKRDKTSGGGSSSGGGGGGEE